MHIPLCLALALYSYNVKVSCIERRFKAWRKCKEKPPIFKYSIRQYWAKKAWFSSRVPGLGEAWA